MTKFTILDSMVGIGLPMHHYDPQVFADDSDWYLRFERYVEHGTSTLCIGCVFTSEQDVSTGDASVLLPMQRTVTARGGNLLISLDNYYSVDFRPLCRDEGARAYVDPLLAHMLRRESPDVVCLRGLDADAPETGLVLNTLVRLGWRPYQSTHQVNWVHELTGDFEGYLASRPSRLKSTLKRKTKKVMGLSGAAMTVHDGKQDLERVLQAYEHVYKKSWKAPEPHTDFIPQLIRASAGKGHLRIGILSIESMPVAVHFWVVKHGVAFIYKLAHDKSFDHYSPGTVLMGHMVKHVMRNDEVKRLDFLSGDDTYKRDWMSVRRDKIKVIAYNPRRLRSQIERMRCQHVSPFVKQCRKIGFRLGNKE